MNPQPTTIPRRLVLADPVSHAELMRKITDPQDLNEALISVAAEDIGKRLAAQVLDHYFGPANASASLPRRSLGGGGRFEA